MSSSSATPRVATAPRDASPGEVLLRALRRRGEIRNRILGNLPMSPSPGSPASAAGIAAATGTRLACRSWYHRPSRAPAGAREQGSHPHRAAPPPSGWRTCSTAGGPSSAPSTGRAACRAEAAPGCPRAGPAVAGSVSAPGRDAARPAGADNRDYARKATGVGGRDRGLLRGHGAGHPRRPAGSAHAGGRPARTQSRSSPAHCRRTAASSHRNSSRRPLADRTAAPPPAEPQAHRTPALALALARVRCRAGVRRAAPVQPGHHGRDHGRAADDRAVRRCNRRPEPGRGRQLGDEPVRQPDVGTGLPVRRLDRGPGRGLPGGRPGGQRLPGQGQAAGGRLAASAAPLRPGPADAGLHRPGVPRSGLDQRPDPADRGLLRGALDGRLEPRPDAGHQAAQGSAAAIRPARSAATRCAGGRPPSRS